MIMFGFGFGCFALGLVVGAFGLMAVSVYAEKKAHENTVEQKTEWNIDVPGVG